jgi:lipopolysaccharide/colanic/teichoic acid biosynthesis glycosyltransferase/energy-coupling factor transporter ATP-binding protein EcfA2
MDIFQEIIKYIKGNAGTNVGLAIIAVIAILAYKVLESVLPDMVKSIAGSYRRMYSKNRKFGLEGVKLRKYIANTANTNWIFTIKSLASMNLNIGLNEVFHLPYFSKYIDDLHTNNEIRDILFKHESFVIVGRPGSGKSSVLNYLAYLFSNDQTEEVLGLKEVRLPFLINLRNIGSLDVSLPKMICDYYQAKNCDITEDFVSAQLEYNRCVIFLDGLDEVTVSAMRKAVSSWLLNAIANHKGNRFIISCRDVDWVSLKIPNLEEFRISELPLSSSIHIINNWKKKLVQSFDTNLDHLIGRITSESEKYRWIISNPLLLTIFILLSAKNIRIPDSRSNLYKIFINILLKEWADTKDNLNQTTNYQAETFALLQTIALYLIEDKDKGEVFDLTDEEVYRFISLELINKFGEEAEISIDLFFNEITSTGILTAVSDTGFVFSNRGFLEYLSAHELIKNGGYEQVMKNIDQDTWYETAVLFFESDKQKKNIRDFIVSEVELPAYYRILSELLVRDALHRDLLAAVTDKLLDYLPQIFTENTIDQRFINNLYRYDPDNVITMLIDKMHTVQYHHITNQVIKAFTIINDQRIIDEIPALLIDLPDQLKAQIVYNLRYNSLSEGLLWGLTNNALLKDMAIESLVAKGISAYKTAIQIVESLHHIFDRSTYGSAAIDTIVKSSRPETFVFLIDIMPKLPIDLLFYIDKVTDGKYRDSMGSKFVLNVYQHRWKRIFDIIISLLVITVTLPFWFFFIILIKLESKGPVFFTTSRQGLRRPILLIKFRTMRSDYASASAQATKSDARVTRVGLFMRKTRMDQLPYFFSVLIGDISIVGPRILPAYVHNYDQDLAFLYEKLYSNFKPGIIGYASVNGFSSIPRSELAVKLSLENELYYAHNFSIALDIKIIFLNFFNFFKGESNAY